LCSNIMFTTRALLCLILLFSPLTCSCYSCSLHDALPSSTNAIESLNSTYRKLNRQRSVFPSDTALLKALYLATFEATKKWTMPRSEEQTSELQSRFELVCRLLLEKKKR